MTHTLFGEPVEILEFIKNTHFVMIKGSVTGSVFMVARDSLTRIPGSKPNLKVLKGGKYLEPKTSIEPLPEASKSLSDIVEAHKLDSDPDPKKGA